MYSYLCGLTFNYICRFYRLPKYLSCFWCIPLPRQLVTQNKTRNSLSWNNAFLSIAKFKLFLWVSSSSLAVQNPCLQLICYQGPTAVCASAPPVLGWGPKGEPASGAENGKGRVRGKRSALFSWGSFWGRKPPPSQLYLCCLCDMGRKVLCKWEAEISSSNGNNQFPFPWHRKSRHETTPCSLWLALPTGLSWLQTEIQFGWKTLSLVIHPVSRLQIRKFICVNKSAFPLILAEG